MGDFRDMHRDGNDPVSQHGVNDPVGGTDVKRGFRDNKSAHERDQWAADVRADSSPTSRNNSCRRRCGALPLRRSTSEPDETRRSEAAEGFTFAKVPAERSGLTSG